MIYPSTLTFCFLCFVGGFNASFITQPRAVQAVQVGDNVTIECYLPKTDFNTMVWYKQELGMMPEPMAKCYNYLREITFLDGFKNERFNVSIGQGIFHLTISATKHEDTAMYFCGIVMLNELRFGPGTFLMIKGVQFNTQAVLQKPIVELVSPGDTVTLQCSVVIGEPKCAEPHRLYWFRHGSGESHPGVIYTHGDSSDQCKKSYEDGYSTQSCVYEFSKRNLSLTDTGTYYCAIAACGKILFGNGTKLNITDNSVNTFSPIFLILVLTNIISVLLIIITMASRCTKQNPSSGSPNCEMSLDTHVACEETLNYAALSLAKPLSSRGTRTQQMLDIDMYSQVKYETEGNTPRNFLGGLRLLSLDRGGQRGTTKTRKRVGAGSSESLPLSRLASENGGVCPKLQRQTISGTLLERQARGRLSGRLLTQVCEEEAENMLTIGLILLLSTITLAKTQKGLHRDGAVVFAKEGGNVTITCIYHNTMAMHFSWYKHKFGQKPELISTIYKYELKATFYYEFKNNPRFSMVNENGMTHLEIRELQLSDSATYYCGSAHSNIIEFGDGTEVLVQASQSHSLSVLQQPVLEPVHPGDSVTLQCTVLTESCAGEDSVYWFRHGSGESHPGIIYTYGDSNDQCKKSSKAGSPTQSCVYKLSKRNLSLSDAGTYYCAVAICGEILFGPGTTLNINITGVDCSDHMHNLIFLSIIRTSVLLFSAGLISIYWYTNQRRNNSFSVTF
ncbi:uncharacterized protein LOC113581829 [Electrophorus electricus]|uniref:uncharacterized protein LOC113581829 n=1 Tax=Electrophorus electricus TaxID=8005 RepID=UPI0015CFCA01|nr:uncharacterized protein LOC113581829 [Electrophorus electricus]